MNRLLTGFVRASGREAAPSGSDAILRPTDRCINQVLVVGEHEVTLPLEPFRWGTACHLEVELNVIANENGAVQVRGHTSFCNGSVGDIPVERDREVLQFLVPQGSPGTVGHPTIIAAHMQSGNDFGAIVISLQNFPAEEHNE